jgi:biopolymer transport protein ExbD
LEKFNDQLIETEIEHQAAEIELKSVAKLDPGSISDGRLPDSYKGAEINGLQRKLQELKTNLDNLSEKYTDDHVEIKALREKIGKTQAELSEAQINARIQYIKDQTTLWLERLNKVEVKEKMLRSRVDELSHELKKLPRLQMEIERRRREKEVAEKTYMILLEQLNEIRPLSEAPKAPGTDAPQQIKLEIKAAASGAMYGAMALENQAVSMENLADVLQKYDPEQGKMLVIVSDRDTPRDQIVKVMDIAKKTGVEKIGFAMAVK